ncbi:MAG TPA: serine/threonine-protein kinase, partial [Polyangiales bacterium]
MEGTRPPKAGSAQLDSSARFRVLQELGRGGKGVVLLVLDRLRGETLALKRLRHTSGLDLRQMKREFRAIERIAHENIVRVYELGLDAQGPYILMEALTGSDLLEHCRPASSSARARPSASSSETAHDPRAGAVLAQTTQTLGSADGALEGARSTLRSHSTCLNETGMGRLCAALPQLLSALECLHQFGLVHRDLKPANVFVRQDQVVKLLDFGILSETGSMSMTTLQGTAAYVAPEQIRGDPPAASNDLYALGVVLFEVVTGHLPFNATSSGDLLLQHLHVQPLEVRALAPECPAWLAQLIDALLIKDPTERMTLSRARELCTQQLGGYGPPLPAPSESPLLEREQEQVALLDVLDATDAAEFQFIGISGASGLGKSALLGWTRTAVRRRQLTLFESRARFSELVPFNAIDGLIDDLASTLERFPELVADAEGQRLCEQGRAAFPVLASGLPSSAPLSGIERRSVFDALIELLKRCTRITGRVLLLCDDLQWSDADSVSFLARMLSTRPAGVTLIATIRDDMHSPAFAAWSRRMAPDLNFALRPLSQQALARIIGGVARGLGRPIDEADSHTAAAGCDGRPLLAVVSGRVVGSRPL